MVGLLYPTPEKQETNGGSNSSLGKNGTDCLIAPTGSMEVQEWIKRRGLMIYALGFFFRVVLIFVGEWQDQNFTVKYTDIDYEVITDAAHHVINGNSPYNRATYRYSPLLAILLVPNVIVHRCWGKLLFSVADLALGRLLEEILLRQGLRPGESLKYACLWIFNPLSINVSTRGSFDSITSALVLRATLSILEGSVFLAAVVFGLVVHLRVYPIIYSLAFVLALAQNSTCGGERGASFPRLFTRKPILFGIVSASTFILCTMLSMLTYGHDFTQNALLYHLTRTDNRHNYSMYWYWIYLDYGAAHRWVLGLGSFVPQVVLLLAVSLRFHSNLPFCVCLQTVVFVVFNKVCTGQYFTWYFSFVPLLVPKLMFGVRQGLFLVGMWVCALALWLLCAWHLEIQGSNTFFLLWGASVLFFLANVLVVRDCVLAYDKI
ncbi:unnamed protein product [Choristocarpus tenellus]